MGSLKPVVPFRGQPLIVSAVQRATRRCARVIVVLGHEAERVRTVLSQAGLLSLGEPKIVVTVNEEYERGMLSSIRCGAKLVGSDWFLVAPGDMPMISDGVYDQIIEAVQTVHPDTKAIFPCIDGRRGHPVAIARTVLPDLIRYGDSGESMRRFLQGYPTLDLPLDISAESAGIFLDVDTPEDVRD